MRQKQARNLSTGIYVRVSTEEQVQEGYSIRGQTEKLKSYALLKEWDIFDIYADEGISGKNIVDRPAINRLIDDIESGKVNNVLVFKVDRLTRSTKNLLELVELFEDCDCAFNSLTESIDTETPSGRMFLKIIGIFAEFERENLATRLKLGFERKVKEGYTLATNIITYGYTREKGQKIQMINADEAKIVRDIYSMFLDNISLNKIARILNERKIPTKLNASAWEGTTIKTILTNPTYIGKVRYSTGDEDRYFEVDGHHEPIISDETFYLAQEKTRNTAHVLKTKRPKEQSYFCGILRCGICENRFTTRNYKTSSGYKTAYRCFTKKSCNTETCESPDISHEKVESAFIDYIQNINDITEDRDINSTETTEKAILESIVDCEKKIESIQNRKKQVMEQYVQAIISFDEYRNMIVMFDENFEVLEQELQRLKAELATQTKTPEVLPEDVVKNIQENWTRLSNKEKTIFLQRFVKSIHITVKKERNRSNVKIDGIEFQSGEIDKREMVRSKLRGNSLLRQEKQSKEITLTR